MLKGLFIAITSAIIALVLFLLVVQHYAYITPKGTEDVMAMCKHKGYKSGIQNDLYNCKFHRR